VIYAYGVRDGVDYTLFRPFNWIGPKLDDVMEPKEGSSRLFTQFISNVIFQKPLQLVDGGRQSRSFTYIDDGVDALLRIIENKGGKASRQIFNIGNTIPSLAVLAIALGIFGIGDRPAITALFLASLLPITRNTYEGMRNVSPALREAARGIGMTPWQSLTRVELPNSLPIIVGGIRTALAINVGSAPLAYLIGADSLGTLIFPGIYLNNQQQMLLGAAATAVLALVLDGIVAAGSRRALARRGLAA